MNYTIPKQLFFIWIGDNKPNYVDFAVKTFKEVNPDFKVNLLEWKIKDIENLNIKNEYDKCLSDCINYILNKSRYNYLIDFYKQKNRKFIQILCNILRHELLFRFGGIYLDCDTFPNKPFDFKLINRMHFHTRTISRFSNNKNNIDVFFLGSIKNIYHNQIYDYFDSEYITDNIFKDEQDRFNFFNCTLKYKLNDNGYIKHFCDFTWNTNNLRTPIYKYDT